MFARVTKYQADPSRIHEMEAVLDGLKDQIQKISGAVAIYNVWRADGQGVVTAICNSQAAADAAADTIQSVWGSVSEMLQGSLATETYDHVAQIKL